MVGEEHTLLLVEDNPDDVELTRRAFARSNIINQLVVVRDGAEALDYLFAKGVHSDRDAADLPHAILLDLNLPNVSGLNVLRRIRSTESAATISAPTATFANRWILSNSSRRHASSGCTGWC